MPKRLLIAEDAFAFAGAEVAAALADAVAKLKAAVPDHRAIKVYTASRPPGRAFRILQGNEIRERQAWIDAHHPRFGPGIAERLAWTRTIAPAEVERMRPQREAVAAHMDALLGDDALLCLRRRRASRRNSTHRGPSSTCFATALSAYCRSPAWRACRRFRCRSAHYRLPARHFAARTARPRPGAAEMGGGETGLRTTSALQAPRDQELHDLVGSGIDPLYAGVDEHARDRYSCM